MFLLIILKIIKYKDDFGKIKLFKYPSSQLNAGFNKYTGHSAHGIS